MKLSSIFTRIGCCKVLVVGDFLLDTYTVGKARRISPEAPVAIVHVQSMENRPGGAGNVALNLVSLGAEVVVIGRIGQDEGGKYLKEELKKENVDISGLYTEARYQTPVKNRVIAENQQIVRIDYESITPLCEQLEQEIIDQLPTLLNNIQIIAVSDYGKGFLSKTLLSAIYKNARKLNIPVITDPKGIDFAKYAGTTVIKPNYSEAVAAAGLSTNASLETIAKRILEISQSNSLMITRSESGISVFMKEGERLDFPVRIREVKDVTGAGDTVLAMLTYALANGLSLSTSAQLANLAAGIAIERLGCARVTLADLAQRLLEYDVQNKVFDEEHLFALQEVLRGKQVNLLGVDGSNGLTNGMFKAIKSLSKNKQNLLIFVKDKNPSEDFISMLASIKDVDFIMLSHDHLRRFCEKIHPYESYSFDNEQLKRIDAHSQLIGT